MSQISSQSLGRQTVLLAQGSSGTGRSRLWPVLGAVLVWGLAGYAASYWALRALGDAPATPLPGQAAPAAQVDTPTVARALGVADAPVATAAPVVDNSGRFSLVGVVFQGATRKGAVGSPAAAEVANAAAAVALIAADGQRPRPYGVGGKVDDRWTVQTVAARMVTLQDTVTGNRVQLQLVGSAGQTVQLP